MVFQNDILAGSSGASGASSVYQIDQSIRFNSTDTAYMHRTPISSGNRDTWTWSCWVKRGNLTSDNATLFQAGADSQSNDVTTILFNGNSGGVASLKFNNIIGGSTKLSLETSQYFRDVSAWYHIVCVYDSNNGTESDRARIYVNGNRVTSFNGSPTFPDGDDSMTNHTVKQSIGRRNQDTSRYMDGYMAEIVLLDGTATDSSSFGEYNSSNIWIPKDVSGLSFGTNGFHIKGEDSSDLGNDSSSNNNDFTTSGLASHDQVADSPTNNFCVMNPLNTHSSITLSNGNLQSTASAFTGSGASILLPSTGKWYAEMRYNNASAGEYPMIGIYNTIKNLSTSGLNPGNTSGDKDIGFGADGRRRENATNTTSWGNAVSDGKIGALAIDMDNKKIWFGHNNSGSFVWQASGNPSAGSNEANTIAFADDVIFGNSHYSSSIVCWNFGQDGTFGGTETAQGNSDANGVGNFYYAPPTNYLALCTKNLGS